MTKVYICTECQGYGAITGGCTLTITEDAVWSPVNCPFGAGGGTGRQRAAWVMVADTKDWEDEE